MDLLNQPWFGSVVGIIGVLFGIAALVPYLRSKIGARPKCEIEEKHLLSKKSRINDSLKILYNNLEINCLYQTTVWIWNNGVKTIEGKHISSVDPVRIQISDDCMILDAKIVKATREVNECSIIVDESHTNQAIISFDFLDTNDGMKLEILHTDDKKMPLIKGTIKGIPRGIKNIMSGSVYYRSFTTTVGRIFNAKVVAGILLFISLVIGIYSFLPKEIKAVLTEYNNSKISDELFLIFSILYLIVAIFLLLMQSNKHPRKLDVVKNLTTASTGSQYKPATS